MSNDVTKKDETITDVTIFTGANIGTGFEDTSAETYKTPFMRVLQMLSPELKKTDPKFIQGASAGMFCNTATKQVSEELRVVILKVEHCLVVWKPDRGGFVGRFPKAQEDKVVFQQDGLQKWDEHGNKVIDTIEFYCMNIDDPTDIFIFPLSTTSLKHARSFATRLRMLKIQGKTVNVSWAGVWKIKTMEESNEKGSWYTIGSTPEFERFVTKEEVELFISPAKEMLKKAETDYSTIESVGTEDQPDTGAGVSF